MAVDGHLNGKIMKNHLYQLFPVSWIVLLNSRSPLHMLPRCKGMRCQSSSFLLLRNSRLNDCKDCRDDSETITICCRPTGIQSHLLGHWFYCFSMLFVFLLLRMVCRYGFSSRSGHSWQILIVTFKGQDGDPQRHVTVHWGLIRKIESRVLSVLSWAIWSLWGSASVSRSGRARARSTSRSRGVALCLGQPGSLRFSSVTSTFPIVSQESR
jgi:hypothetical protein